MGCCDAFSGIAFGCDTSVGGITEAYIACKDSITAVTLDATKGLVSDITFDVGSWKKYEFRPETSSVDEPIQQDNSAGSLYFSPTVTLQFSRQELSKRNEVLALAKSSVVIVVKDNNGEYHYYGNQNYMYMSEGDIPTGTAYGDFNGYTLTFTSGSPEPGLFVSEEAMEKIVADAA